MLFRARIAGCDRLLAPVATEGPDAATGGVRPAAAFLDPRQTDWEPALAFLRPGARVLLTTHVHPDGDGLGSQAALVRVLQQRGCEAWILNPDPVPEVFRFLFAGLEDHLLESGADLPAVDGAVILDVSSLKRLGAVGARLAAAELPLLVIDHHLSNEVEGGLVYAFPAIGSTGEVLAALLDAADCIWTPEIATAIYTAVVTDSGGFIYAATTAETLELAARLVRLGADPCWINEQVHQNYPARRYDLLARFLASMQVRAGGGLLVFELTREMLAASGARREESEGFANIGLGIRGCRMTLIFTDLSAEQTKINLRSKAPYDVCALARRFGGGGHRFAAGATIDLPFAQAREAVLAAAEACFETGGETPCPD
jgi:bifunctional oligoribonuclease and PAP phosphatase NrnA